MSTDSSPFQSSPMDGTTSPRLFWQNRNVKSENTGFSGRSGSPSPTRRSSIERLQKASRVKNSNILALEQKQEYDPTRLPQVERPLARVQGNAYGGAGIAGLRAKGETRGHARSESKTNIPLYSPTKAPAAQEVPELSQPRTPSKAPASPIKSSLSTSRFKSSYDEHGDFSASSSAEERELPKGKSLHRHAKSVTFDAAPPQINEYEMATPDLSSIGSNSREGSYDSGEDDDDFQHPYPAGDGSGQDDSFDASLEDTDKTPVVGPEDWRHGSPEAHRDGRFDGSPLPENAPTAARRQHERTDSTNSNGDHRPLPPLPGLQRTQSNSPGLSAVVDRVLGTQRSLPPPPPAASTKSEIQNIGNPRMTLEERLKLMMLSDGGKTAAEQQRERRMRRAGTRDRLNSPTPEPEARDAAAHDEEDDTIGDLSGLEEYQSPPRISRESIMRRVNGNKPFERESDYLFSSPAPSSSPTRPLPLDPDIPIPSTEESIVEDEPSLLGEEDEEKGVDTYSVSDMYVEDEAGEVGVVESHHSDGDGKAKKTRAQEDESEVTTTPRAGSPAVSELDPTTEDYLARPASDDAKAVDFASGLQSFMLPRPEDVTGPKMADAHAYLQRPYTPDQPLSKPEYDGSGWGDDDEYEEPGTPDSVIHHPIEDEVARDSPAIPEQLATIKASGSKLKTRPSATPTDLMAMREARRQVSGEVPGVPPIPARHRNRLSPDRDLSASDDFLERHPSFKKRSLTLELDLGLSLDRDFERVIEAQKVAFHQFPSRRLNAPATPCPPTRQASRVGKEEAAPCEAKTTVDTNITSRKQRGYLMRQNTKLVAATDKETEDLRGARSAGNSPIKKERPQSWTVEPWNGQRRKSVRKRTALTGPVPPLPGQESNAAAALNPLAEEDLAAEMATAESGERGRLFVKVMGVKDLDLPLPKGSYHT